MYFVAIQTVLEMHWLLTGIGKQMHSNGIWSRKNAFPEHSKMHLFLSWIGNKCIQMVIRSTKNAFHEQNRARNAFVPESDWQANAFIWSFGST